MEAPEASKVICGVSDEGLKGQTGIWRVIDSCRKRFISRLWTEDGYWFSRVKVSWAIWQTSVWFEVWLTNLDCSFPFSLLSCSFYLLSSHHVDAVDDQSGESFCMLNVVSISFLYIYIRLGKYQFCASSATITVIKHASSSLLYSTASHLIPMFLFALCPIFPLPTFLLLLLPLLLFVIIEQS